MKILKRIALTIGALVIVLLAAAFILPVVFKDDIKAAIDKELAKSVNADIKFDVNNFSLSFFRHFPSVTAEIKDFGVFNRAPFEGEHLFVVEQMDVEVNLKDILFGDQLRIKAITLVNPQVNVKVLADGRANYDIAIPSADSIPASQEPSNFSFGIDHWEVIDGDITYDDKSIPYFLELNGVDHTGSGDFTQDVFDLRTHTTADTVTTGMGNLQFLTRQRAEVDAVISISDQISKFTFKENKAKVNDFALSFDGWFKMLPDHYEMDITFKSPDNSFKSLLSLVPAVYTKDFSKVQTSGDLAFNGWVKGAYSEKQLPAFNVELLVKEGMFKYPDLPTSVQNINMDLLVNNPDGVVDHTAIDLRKLHLDFGNNPVDARVKVENLKDYRMDAAVKASLNLAELTKMVPMEGMELAGLFKLDAAAKGAYDPATKMVPASGTLALKDFLLKAKGNPDVAIQGAETSFDPSKVVLKSLKGSVGRTDFDVTGQVANYLPYVFKGETIKGNVTFKSNLVDLNEFMTSEPSTTSKDTSKLSVIPIPKNIDFVMKSAVATVKMMDYTLTNASGDIVLKDGIANLSGLQFNMLGGRFTMNGSYNANDLQHPKYDFGLKVDALSIQQAAQAFSIIKTYAPVAGLVNGNFSTDFKIGGELKSDMMPNMGTVNGAGLIKIAQASMTQSKLVAGISSLTNLNSSGQVSLKDVLMSASISDGKLSVKPFDVKFGDYATTISGTTSLDGTIDYQLKMMVPAGQLGSQVQSFVGQYTGAKPTDKIPVNIALGGTYNDPKPKLIASEQKEQVKQAVTNAVKEKGQEAVQKLTEGTKAGDLVKGLLGQPAKADTTKKDSTKKEPVDVLQNKLQNLLKKKKKDNP